jgi:NAD(P)-dependent dehydrogenase (short-subunit alcohol dehydrogenase family)
VDLKLQNSRAFVAGSFEGIGRAIVERFAAEGAHVALLDRNPGVAEAAFSIAERFHVVARDFVGDVCDFAAVRRAWDEWHIGADAPHHVVFAVGAGSGKSGFPFWKLSPADWPRVLEVNLIGAVNVAHAVAPALAAARRGTLLFLSSVAGQIGSQTDPPYSAAKAALINFSQCAAKDLAPYGVRVNTICPGMVATSLGREVYRASQVGLPEHERQSFEDWGKSKLAKLVPMNRWQQPDEVAAMAAFLASDEARNITGQTINVDGGYVMHW